MKRHPGACAQLILLQFFSSICNTRRGEEARKKQGIIKRYFKKGPLIIQVILGRDFNEFAVGPDKPQEPELAWPSGD